MDETERDRGSLLRARESEVRFKAKITGERSGRGCGVIMSVSFTKLHIHSAPGLSCLLLSRCFGLLPIAQ